MSSENNLTVEQFMSTGLVDDNTRIIVFDGEHLLFSGFWYEDKILSLGERIITFITWHSGNVSIALN